MATHVRRVLLVLALVVGSVDSTSAQVRATVVIRGRPQVIYRYGPPGGDPVIVSSGDGGWIHLAPHVAGFLSQRGFSVIGFDVRAYLASFTTRDGTLQPEDEPGDYKVLVDLAATATHKKPLLIGVSEGAGLSVLAAAHPQINASIAGVIALGLPDRNELGWRWRDAMTYLTHRAPNEPSFSTAAVAGHVTPVPLAAIHSLHDEFVPLAEVERVLQNANEPKKLWVVKASNHRFSDNVSEFEARLVEAIVWVGESSRR